MRLARKRDPSAVLGFIQVRYPDLAPALEELNRDRMLSFAARRLFAMAGVTAVHDLDNPETLRQIASACQRRAKGLTQRRGGRLNSNELHAKDERNLRDIERQSELFREFHELTTIKGLSKGEACREIVRRRRPDKQGDKRIAENFRKRIAYAEETGLYYYLLGLPQPDPDANR